MINIYRTDTDKIAREYRDKVRNWLENSKQKAPSEFQKKILKNEDEHDKMLSYVYERIKSNDMNLLISKPNELIKIENDFNNLFRKEIDGYQKASKDQKPCTSYGQFKFTMKSMYAAFFNMKQHSQSKKEDYTNGFWLIRKLNIKVCPYCNRNYTISIDKKSCKTRPEIDHNLPQSLYPILSLSFYNLIPACPTCNHLKSNKEIKYNPYSQEDNDIQFKVNLTTTIPKTGRTHKEIISDSNYSANRYKEGLCRKENILIFHEISGDFICICRTKSLSLDV